MNTFFFRTRSISLIVATLIAFLLAACAGNASSGPASSTANTTITIWHNWQGSYLQAKQTIFDAYTRQDPHVKFSLVHQNDVIAKSINAVKAGSGPDIIAYTDDNLGKLALSGTVEPLDQYISQNFLRQTYSPAAADALIFNNHVYGVPESVETITLMYNKALVTADQLPKNSDELLSFEQSYAKSHPNQYGVVWNTVDPYTNAPWFYGFGAQYLTADGNANLHAPAAVAAMQYIASFRPYLPKQESYDVASSLFTEGKAAAIINGPWSYTDYAQKAKINVGFALLPIISGNKSPARPFVGVKSLWMAKTAKNPAVVTDFMKFYTSTANQIAMAQANGEIPANQMAVNDPTMKALPAVAGYAEQVKYGVALPNTPNMFAIWNPLQNALTAVWNGSQTPEAALQDAQGAAQKTIQQINS